MFHPSVLSLYNLLVASYHPSYIFLLYSLSPTIYLYSGSSLYPHVLSLAYSMFHPFVLSLCSLLITSHHPPCLSSIFTFSISFFPPSVMFLPLFSRVLSIAPPSFRTPFLPCLDTPPTTISSVSSSLLSSSTCYPRLPTTTYSSVPFLPPFSASPYAARPPRRCQCPVGACLPNITNRSSRVVII